MPISRSLVAAAVLAVAAAWTAPPAVAGGPTGQPAPKWDVETWFNLPAGKEKLEVSDYAGRVTVTFHFQSW